MDYDTFVNSAYLRQGRADEFMLKRPGDRKQVLAEILNLSEYDQYAEQAKDIARACRGEVAGLESQLANIRQQITAGAAIANELTTFQSELERLQTADRFDRERLLSLTQQQQQRQQYAQQFAWQKQQRKGIQQDAERLHQQLTGLWDRLQALQAIAAESATIAEAYALYQQLHIQESDWNDKQQQWQTLSVHRAELINQLTALVSDRRSQLRQCQTQRSDIEQQLQQLQVVLGKGDEIEAALSQLQRSREELSRLERLQSQAAPLEQRSQEVQRQIDRAAAQLLARQEELLRSRDRLVADQASQAAIQSAMQEVDRQIATLQKRQVYQQRVHEKGLERRDFLERLKVRAADSEEKFQQVQVKLAQLNETTLDTSVPGAGDPHCPLCDSPLNAERRQLVRQKHQENLRDIQAEIWLIVEQQSVSECEIQVLREEYRALAIELGPLNSHLERRGHLQAQMQAIAAIAANLQQLDSELAQIATRLHAQNYATAAQEELQLLQQSLARLNFDEKNLALARGEVERWRWAEMKTSELKQARRESERLTALLPEVLSRLQQLAQQLERHDIDPELQQQLDRCDRAIAQLAYDAATHQQIRTAREIAMPALLRERELVLAQQQLPSLTAEYQAVQKAYSDRREALQSLERDLTELDRALKELPESAAEIAILQEQCSARRLQMDRCIAAIGSLQQAQQQLLQFQQQEQTLVAQLARVRARGRIHQELAQAFGKHGIQALLLETILPQIEAEANRILGQLSDYQLHVRFITQKSGKKSDKLIDTLDIEIADSRGTRPYETYSGGEAFRINFAIRLALARILSQRSGSPLQTLIVDEGFGSQDGEGCDRLVAAINAIAPDFECILAITHMPQLKEAFTALLEVTKTDAGSQVRLVV